MNKSTTLFSPLFKIVHYKSLFSNLFIPGTSGFLSRSLIKKTENEKTFSNLKKWQPSNTIQFLWIVKSQEKANNSFRFAAKKRQHVWDKNTKEELSLYDLLKVPRACKKFCREFCE